MQVAFRGYLCKAAFIPTEMGTRGIRRAQLTAVFAPRKGDLRGVLRSPH